MVAQELANMRDVADVSAGTAEDELLAHIAPGSGSAMPGERLVHDAPPVDDLPAVSLRRIDALLSQLEEVEHDVLRRLFGLDGAAPASARQIAEALNLTVAQVNALHTRALAGLRSASLEGLEFSGN